ncbi:Gfo/Idh/MocA family protein, partial [Vagococcus salmoninarum]|uniref:Gfo/Idh/MocA family protein n=1 Tax=Vagococcus salmoninarum TaxID=2739 RepID=UPI003F9B8B0C
MTTVKIGIVGLGRLGQGHAKNLAFNIPNCELYGACSPVVSELEWAQGELGVTKTYTDYAEMVADPEIEAVFIASPSGLHCQQIMLAMAEGIHVFSEQ